MKCSVPFCTTKDATRYGRGQDISLFSFPKDPNIREAWQKILGINWQPKHLSFVCSEHFRPEDLYETSAGLRMLHTGALPVKILDADALAAFKVCRICLTMDTEMYDFAIFEQMFEQITGILTDEEEARWLPKRLCWECAARLKAAVAIRDKAFISDGLLHNLLKTSNQLKISDIRTINRLNSGLKTHLVQTVLDCEHYELKVNDTFVDTVHNSDSDNEIPNNDNRLEILETNTLNNITVLNENTLPEESDTRNTNDDMLCDEFDYSDDKAVNTDVIKIKNKTGAELKEDMLRHIIEITEPLNKAMNVTKIPVQKNNHNEMFFQDLNSDDDETDEKDLNTGVTAGDSESEEIYEHVDINKYVTKVPSISVQKDKSGARYYRFNKKEITRIDETIFEITRLSYDQQMKEIEARKYTPGYKNAPYKCTVCYKAFSFKDTYNSHMFLHSRNKGAHECYICARRHRSAQSLRTHILGMHTIQYNCKLCDFSTRHRHMVLSHMRFHQGKKYKCSLCPMEFNMSTSYFGHLRFKHMFDWVCDLCGYAFISDKGVKLHKLKKHRTFDETTPRKGPHCDVCDIKFLSQDAYDTHLKVSSKHLNGEHDPMRIRNEPNIYDSKKSSRERLFNNMRPRRPRGPNKIFTCEQCGVLCRSFAMYEQHFAREHPDDTMTQTREAKMHPAMCDQCGKILSNIYRLENHKLGHIGVKQFQCDHCKKFFSQKGTLIQHMFKHTGDFSANKCPQCDKCFTYSSNLKRHMLLHTGLKPYKCHLCDNCYPTSDHRSIHIKHFHYRKPWPKKKKKNQEKNVEN